VTERAECAENRDDLAAYALGALPPDEAETLERHLDSCESCQARLRWLSPAVDLLPAAVEQRTPPPSLRENLLATVRAEADTAAKAAEPTGAEGREPWWSGLRSLAMRPAAGFAAVILLVVGLGAGYLLGNGGSEDAGTELVKAESLNGATPVSATLERDGDRAVLRVQALPAIAEDEVYEIWVQRAGVLEPRNTFVLRMDGTAEATVPGPLEGGDAVLVTREPDPGSRQPTTDPILSAPL
jgi:anti-sigma-K factor RskA